MLHGATGGEGEVGATPSPRAYRDADHSGVVALIARCYGEFGLTLNLNDACEAHLADPGAHFRAGGGEYWVMTDEAGEVRATCALWLERGPGGVRAELKSMYVDPSWRRRGVGRALTRRVMEAARTAGARELELWSDTRFEPAHRMYESLGFVRWGEREVDDSNNSREFGYRRGV